MIALARRHWWLVLLWIAGVASVARLTAFMIDPARTAGSIVPDDDFYSHHNCATAYVRAGELAQARVANLYLEQHYWGSRPDDPRASIGPFAVDLYEYPPPFLLPVRAALAVTRDFMTLRVAWFVVELALLLYAGYRLAHWIGGRSGRRIVALAPALIASAPALATLQLGNFQLAAYSLSILAMVAFADRRDALGGALLAFAIASKVFPGLLLVVLVARRRWAAVGWTLAFGALYCALALAAFGPEPFAAFVHYQLPRMADGTAFPFLAEFPPATAVNHSIFGLVLKLRVLGVAGMTTGLASALAWLYTLAIIGFAARHAVRPGRDRYAEGLFWLVLLQLAALRSPFTPDVYALFLPCVIAVVCALRASRGGRALWTLAWIAMNAAIVALPVTLAAAGTVSIATYLALTGAVQLVGFVVTALAIRAIVRP